MYSIGKFYANFMQKKGCRVQNAGAGSRVLIQGAGGDSGDQNTDEITEN